MSTSFRRLLGRSGIQISAMGMGCWAIGGPFWNGETPSGWGEVDDEESIRAVHRALDLGVNFFDTANVYGATPTFDRPGAPPASEREPAEQLLDRGEARDVDGDGEGHRMPPPEGQRRASAEKAAPPAASSPIVPGSAVPIA